MHKMKNSKGFTLMEMLIVVAIIAVLIAIAIPTFNASLNKARVATDEANIRSGYASVMAKVLTEDLATEAGKTFVLQKDGNVAEQKQDATIANSYQCFGEPTGDVEIAGQTVKAWKKESGITYTVKIDNQNKDGVVVAIDVGDPQKP